MIESMTGYGQSEIERDQVRLTAEVRSVNNRFLDLQIRMPKFLQPLESRVRETVGRFISRGKINLVLTWEETDEKAVRVSLDLEAARAYHKLLGQLRESVDIADEVRLEHLMAFSEIFQQEREQRDVEQAWPLVKETVEVALEDLKSMRRKEGQQLFKDMQKRVALLQGLVNYIESRYPEKVDEMKRQLRSKIAALLETTPVDEQRLAMEVALLAEKADITEECVRFRSHNQLFLSALEEPGPVGRKLTFLLQEMNRESNTMASKASDVQVAHQVVAIKEEIERLREQVQNIE